MAGECLAPGPKPAATAAIEAGRSHSLRWGAAQRLTPTTKNSLVSAANARRRGLILQNLHPLLPVFVNFGGSAAAGAGLLIPANGSLTWSGDDVPTESVNIAIASGNALVPVIFLEAELR